MNKLNIEQLIAVVDKSEKNEHELYAYYSDPLCRALNIDVSVDYKILNTRLKRYWVYNWYCTDTWVGMAIIFLDDEFVCVTYQSGRKSDEQFWFYNKEAKEKVRQYILSLADPQYDDDNDDYIGADFELDDHYKIEYSSQLIDWRNAKPLYNGEEVKIIEIYEYNFRNDDTMIQFKDGSTKVIGCRELDFPIITKP